jgi:hypothetical protein
MHFQREKASHLNVEPANSKIPEFFKVLEITVPFFGKSLELTK